MLSQQETLSLHKLLDGRSDRIILVSLSVNTLLGDAQLFGSLLTHMIVSAAMRKERRDKKGNELCFYLDEFEHFEGLGDTFANMLSEGRKFGLCLCLSHQTTVQLETKLQSLNRNVVGTQIFFSVGGGDSETLVGEIPTDEPKAILRNLLMNQKVGECVVVQKGKPYTRVRIHHSPDPDVSEQKVDALRLSAFQRWGRPEIEIEQALADRECEFTNRSPGSAHSLMTTVAPVKNKAQSSMSQTPLMTTTIDKTPESISPEKDMPDTISDSLLKPVAISPLLEVREDAEDNPHKPTRSRRKKTESSS